MQIDLGIQDVTVQSRIRPSSLHERQTIVAVLALGLAGICACGGDGKAQALIESGDWAGARNVLQAELSGSEGKIEDRALLLFAHAVPDTLGGSTDSWFVKACALDEQGSQYILQPMPDEADRLVRLRNDMRRTLTDKGISTADPQEYGELLRETVRYGLQDHVWKPEHLMAQGAIGLCGTWLGVDGSEQAMVAPLASKAALAKGAERYLALGGDRVISPLRIIASNTADVASGPASDVLRDVLLPAAEDSILGSVGEPSHPQRRIAEVVRAEKVAMPDFTAQPVRNQRETSTERVRGWFSLSRTKGSDVDASQWAGYSLEINSKPVMLFWTWDSQAAMHRLYGLTWSGTDWVRVSFDGQDPLSHASQIVLGFTRPGGDSGDDLVAMVFDGVAEQVEQVETWAGAVQKKSRGSSVLRRGLRLEGSSFVTTSEEAE